MVMLQAFFTLLLFITLWFITEPATRRQNQTFKSAYTMGTFFLSGILVSVAAATMTN